MLNVGSRLVSPSRRRSLARSLDVEGENVEHEFVGQRRFQSDGAWLLKAGDVKRVEVEA